jgi:hypothetical protein
MKKKPNPKHKEKHMKKPVKKKKVSQRKLVSDYAKNYKSKYIRLSDEARKDAATELLQSIRGKYVLGQACAIAYAKLRNEEPSNADDIALLGEKYFGWFYAMTLGKLGISDGRNGSAND